jgi:TPR repeat protein
MYAEGLGIPKNLPEAIRLYEAAAKAGEFFAQVDLARLYSKGTGVPADKDAARKWYSAAAAQADRVADCEELREAKVYVANGR